MNTADDSKHRYAVKLLRKGIISPSEFAGLVGVSRQAARWWVRDMDWNEARQAYLDRLWNRRVEDAAELE